MRPLLPLKVECVGGGALCPELELQHHWAQGAEDTTPAPPPSPPNTHLLGAIGVSG